MRLGLPKNDHLLPKLKDVFSAQDMYLEDSGDRNYVTKLYGDEFHATVCLMKQKVVVDWVAQKRLEAGIAGLDCVMEFNARAVAEGSPQVRILESLSIGQCALKIAVAKGCDDIDSPSDLHGKRIATPFPGILARYMRSQGATPTEVIEMDSSVEAAIPMGQADAILDIVEKGETLKANGLKPLFNVMALHAVVIAPATADIYGENYMQVRDFVHQLTTPRLPQADMA